MPTKTKTVFVCGCGRERSFRPDNTDMCQVCGKEICLGCRGVVVGCVHSIDICAECDELPWVRQIADRYAVKLRAILARRTSDLKRIGGRR